MTDFREGDRVRIREDSNYYGRNYNSNPADVTGTVIEAPTHDIGLSLRVRWDERGVNSYNYHDLEHVAEWIRVVSSPSGGRDRWELLLSKFNRVNNRVCHWPLMSRRVFIHLSRRVYTNHIEDTGRTTDAGMETITLEEILGG